MRSFHITINLMEIKKQKVEIDEIDLGFCFIHVLYKILSCGYTNLMGVYRIGIRIGRKHNWAKSMIFMDYYNIMYEGHYEKW